MGKHAPTTRRLGVYLGWKIRITGIDGKTVTGTLTGFDRHVNVILMDAEEHRTLKNKNKAGKVEEHSRTLGFVVIRGDCILSVECIEKPKKNSKKKDDLSKALPKLGMPLMGKGMPGMMGMMPKMGMPFPGMGKGMPGMMPGLMPGMMGMGKGGGKGMPMPPLPGGMNMNMMQNMMQMMGKGGGKGKM